MSHRNLVARKTTFHSPRATPFSFLPRSKKNFSYRTMIVKFFSENEGQLATTENQLTSKRQSICEREIQSQFSTKNQRLTSFHISNLRAFWRRSWKTGNTFLGRKIPYARDIYIYIYYIHERILSHQSKHSISHFFPRRVLYNETAIVGIQAGTQLDGRVARKQIAEGWRKMDRVPKREGQNRFSPILSVFARPIFAPPSV